MGSLENGYFIRGSVEEAPGVWSKCAFSDLTAHSRESSHTRSTIDLWSALCMFLAHFTTIISRPGSVSTSALVGCLKGSNDLTVCGGTSNWRRAP